MAEYDVTIPADFLSSFLTDPKGIAKLVETTLNQILDGQATEQIGASRNTSPSVRTDREYVSPAWPASP